jgi:predicted AlkP superfamily phosphohydrolase/phosphomutase
MIGLDGFELSLAERLMAQGRLPTLRRLTKGAARFHLDHGAAKRTGLAWEHVSTGLSPEDARRWAAVDFDPLTYAVTQRPTTLAPFAARVACRTVIFDPPYFDLTKAPKAEGLVSWGAHDPGVAQMARPSELLREIEARFGGYPAQKWIYGFVWPSAEQTREMADALVRAVDVRADIAEWLFAERLPDWGLGYLVISEYHSAVEALWHGVDANHPLAGLPSAEPARLGIERVYEAADRMLGRLMDRFPDAQFAIFNLHGMGSNDSDVPSMALLPELLYRHRFGKPFRRERIWSTTTAGVPLITNGKGWSSEIIGSMPSPLLQKVRSRFRRVLKGSDPHAAADGLSLSWMPAERYRPLWPRMDAFALPSFYDGRIRINLRGRERRGRVTRAAYDPICDEIVGLLEDCRDPITDLPVIRDVDRKGVAESLGPSEADMVVLWQGAPLGFTHPRLGQIGPLPYRRTGGHTGKTGIAYFQGPGIRPGQYGNRSAFDVLPTVLDLLGEQPACISGATAHGLIAA